MIAISSMRNRLAKIQSRKTIATRCCVAALLIGANVSAHAAGTEFGALIDNSFTLDYNQGADARPTLTNADAPVSFNVDRLVDLTVANMGAVDVVPGSQNQTMLFSVLNTGNRDEQYQLTFETDRSADFTPTLSGVEIYIDDGDGVFEPGDNDIALGDYRMGGTTQAIPADTTIWVAAQYDIPEGYSAGDAAQVTLIAQTYEVPVASQNGTATKSQNPGVASAGRYADGAGTDHETMGDGAHSAQGTFNATAAAITSETDLIVFDESDVSCSDWNGRGNGGLFIPGACIEYSYTYTHDGSGGDAENVNFSTTLAPQLKFASVTTSGFSSVSLIQPDSGADCNIQDCAVQFADAGLAASSQGTVRIRAIIQ